MSQKFNLYIGKAGQLMAMAAFLIRGWNVAMPEVDTGDDIFVVEDDNNTFFRVQVKTAQSVSRKNSYSAQFNIPLKQLNSPNEIVYFVFLILKNNKKEDILLIRQAELFGFFKDRNMGTVHNQNVVLYLSGKNNKITCSGIDFTPFIDNYTDFPLVIH